jgi:hypothetical protein
LLNQFIDDLRLVFGEKIVAAVSRRDDFTSVAERFLKRAAWTDRPDIDAWPNVASLLTADLREKLIQVMDDADFLIHAFISQSTAFTALSKRIFTTEGTEFTEFGEILSSLSLRLCAPSTVLRTCFAGDHSEFFSTHVCRQS